MKENIENLDKIISKLKKQGIKAGENEQEKIIAAAKQKAEKIISEAEAKSSKMVEEAQKEAEQLEKNSKASIAQASRDLIEATKIEIIQTLKATFGKKSKKLLTEEQYLQQILKLMLEEIKGNKKVEVPSELKDKMEAFLSKTALDEGVELKPLKQSEAKISVKSDSNKGIQYVLTTKDVEDAMFLLINNDFIERITKGEEE